MASERRDVELLIRARDLSSRTLKDVAGTIDRISAGIQAQAEAAQRGEASLDELKTTYQQLEKALKAIGSQEAAVNLFVRISAQLEAAKQKAAAARAAFDQFGQAINAAGAPTKAQQKDLERLGRSADAADASVSRIAASLERQAAKLRQAGIPIDQLAQAQDDLVGAGQRAASSLGVVERAIETFGHATRQARDDAKRLRDELAAALPPQRINAILTSRQEDAAAQKQLAAFRELADRAEQTARSYRSLDGATRDITVSGQNVATTVRKIVDEAGVERSTLGGLEKQVRDLATAIAAINGPVKDYEASLLRLGQAQRAASRQAELIDAWRRQGEQLRAARAAFSDASRDVRTYAAQVRQSSEPNKELADRLKQAETALAAANRELRKQIGDARALREELARAGLDTRNLGDAQQRLVNVARRAADAQQRLNNAFEQFGRSNRGGGLFGLSPYAIQNLGFQINDVLTQLASGTSVTQTLAQQGGQFLQVFNVGFDKIAARAPQIVAAIAAIGVTVAALNRQFEALSAQRGFEGLIRASADGARFQAAALTEATRAIQRYGASFADAETAVRTFVLNGVNPARIVEFGRTAQNLADVFRVSLPDAAKALAESFNGGYDAIKRLNDQFPLLDAARLNEIRRLFEQGRAQEAVTLALQTFVQKSDDAASQARGPWTNAFRDLRRAWDDLLQSIGNTLAFRAAVAAVNGLATTLRGLSTIINELTGNTGRPADAAAGAAFAAAQRRLLELERRRQEFAANPPERTPGDTGPTVTQRLDREIAQQRAEVARLEREWQKARDAAAATAAAAGQTTQATSGAVAQTERARAEAQRLTDEQREQLILGLRIKDVTQDQLRSLGLRNQRELELQRIRIAGEQAARSILAADSTATDLADQARQRAEVQERQRIADEMKSAGTSAREQVRRDLQAIEQDFNSLKQSRDALIGEINDRLRAGSISAVEAFDQARQVAERFQPRLRALADEMQRFRDANRGSDVVRDMRMDANVDRFSREAGTAPVTRAGEEALRAGEQEVNRILQERAALVQSITNLARARGLAESEVSERTQQAYASTNEQLTAAIDGLQRLIDRLREAGNVAPAALDRMQAKVEEFRTQVEYVDPAMVRMRNSIENAFTSGMVQGFKDIADAIAGVITGTKEWGDVLQSVGNAALNLLGRVLTAIAEEIIKTQALIAIKMILKTVSAGVAHGGAVIGSVAGGRRTRRVDPAWFAGAPRYHSGSGVIGLRPDEQAAILQKGEEVLARDDPRNIANLAKQAAQGGTGEGLSIRNVLAFSEADVAAALATAHGERVVLAHIKRNAPSIRQMVNGSR